MAANSPIEYTRNMTRPDMYVISGYEGRPLDLVSLQYLPNERLQTAQDQIERMAIAALEDYQSVFPSAGFTPDLLAAVEPIIVKPATRAGIMILVPGTGTICAGNGSRSSSACKLNRLTKIRYI
jgi:hypothetical protein